MFMTRMPNRANPVVSSVTTRSWGSTLRTRCDTEVTHAVNARAADARGKAAFPRRRPSGDLAEEIGFAELDTVVAQQVVRSRDVKEEVRQRPVAQEYETREGERAARCIDRNRAAFGAFELLRLEAVQVVDGAINTAISSENVASLSSKLGGSVPLSLAAAPLAASVAIWTCRDSANMSGNSRLPTSTAGSIFFASACAAPFLQYHLQTLQRMDEGGD